jgi:hypothetical protein
MSVTRPHGEESTADCQTLTTWQCQIVQLLGQERYCSLVGILWKQHSLSKKKWHKAPVQPGRTREIESTTKKDFIWFLTWCKWALMPKLSSIKPQVLVKRKIMLFIISFYCWCVNIKDIWYSKPNFCKGNF